MAGIITAAAVGAGISGGIGLIGANQNKGGGGGGGMNAFGPAGISNFIFALINGNQQQKAWAKTNLENIARYDEAKGLATSAAGDVLKAYDTSSDAAHRELQGLGDRQQQDARRLGRTTRATGFNLLEHLQQRGQQRQQNYGQGLNDFMQGARGDEAGIIGGYRDRYKFAEDELQGYGEQQKADINLGFEQKGADISQDLISRGLSASSVGAVNQTLNEQARSAEQRRLGEDLTRNRVNILGGILGEQSLAQERLSGQRQNYGFAGLQTQNGQQAQLDAAQAALEAAVRGDVLSARKYMMDVDATNSMNMANFFSTDANNRAQLTGQGTDRLINLISSRQDVGPPPNQIPFQFGQNSGGSAQAPGWGNPFLGAAAQGAGNAFGNFALNAFKPQQQQQGTQYGGYTRIPQYNPPPNSYNNASTEFPLGYVPQYVPYTPPPQYGPAQGYDPFGYGPPAW